MMYLVLTAMLALNVSTNVLDAFAKVDASLHVTLDNTVEQNAMQYRRFERAYAENPTKVGALYMQADSLRKASDELYDYIQNFKVEVTKLVDGESYDSLARKIINTSDFDHPGTYALVMTDPETGLTNGEVLRNKIEAYRELLMDVQHFSARARNGKPGQIISGIFSTAKGVNNDGDSIPWEASVFDGMPAGACLAILTKYQNDIRSYENRTVTRLYQRITANDFTANDIRAYVIPKSSYVIRGDQYEAQIILAATDSTARPDYFVNGVELGDDGIYRCTASGSGLQTYNGIVRYKQGRDTISLPFEASFTVGEPSASVMNEDLNIIYQDYDNRYVVSAPGVTDNQLKVSVTGASVRRQGKFYILRPNAGAKSVRVLVQADMGGRMATMGEKNFKVQKLPQPSPYFVDGGKQVNSSATPRKSLNKNTVLEIGYGEDGLLEVPFEITSFDTYILRKTGKSSGNKFSAAQLKLISQLKSGDMVLVQNIKYRTKGGSETLYQGNLALILK
ncbi:MAG: gliding motility protein GldM [Paludibacteraceae bacterium]|nr:gliding motility protein GldM [Paludibacteraceae bacterium]